MDKKFTTLVLVFFLVLGTFATSLYFEQTATLRARATQKCSPVAEKSFAVSFPKVVAKGESCEVNVFARCEDESGVPGAVVSIAVSGGTAQTTQNTTDENGNASFTVTPEGLASITATINNSIQVPTQITCESQ